MNSKFFTNDGDNTLLQKFKAVFDNNPQIAEFDVLVGYFYATGYLSIRQHLQNVDPIRVLVGINVDLIVADAQKKGLSLHFGATPDQIWIDYQQRLTEEINHAEYAQSTETSILRFVEDINRKKIIVRAHPTRKLHAKIYIFRPLEFNQHRSGEVISGSSNFTSAGLGAAGSGAGDRSPSYEFNVSLRDYDDVKFATDEFEKLWAEAVDILPKVVIAARDKTYLRDDITPFDIYIKFLIAYFGKEIEFDPNSITDLPAGFKRLNYQMDAVEQGHILLTDHNGFFLSDVVGLGKTMIAILIARKYFYGNGYPEYRSHILIVCPPAVKTNWEETVKQFQIDNVEFITTGSLHKITDPKKYDLIIVDEAHKFRNNTSESYALLEKICKSRCRNGNKKRVILVSATPLNNRPDDIRNQLLLFQDANDSTLDINIGRFFRKASKQYKQLSKPPASADPCGRADLQAEIEKLYGRIRDKIIEPLTVRRTRTDLIRHPLYADDLQQQGINFPLVQPPENLLYQLNTELNHHYQQSFDRIKNSDDDGNGLKYARYRLIEHLKPEHRQDYLRPELITQRLAGIMKTLLIKRLDSSFYAFHQSLQRFVRSAETVQKMIANNRIFIAPDWQIEEYIKDNREDELLEMLANEQLTDPSIKILTCDDFEPELFDRLQHDYQLLTEMESQWRGIVSQLPDPKLQLLLAELPRRLLNRDQQHNPEGKLVIFSESTDTTGYLLNRLRQEYRVLAITSKNRLQQQRVIRQNFDANLAREEQRSDYDILIATESLAEGVNLHRANTIVNYDIPWNATRLIQRIGRINRIGSQSQAIHIYNFFPTEQVEDDIGLQRCAQIKLQAFHTALGEDSQIYTTDEEVQTFGLFDQNITEEQEINERLTYLMEIRRFREQSPDEFKRIENLPLKIRNAVIDSASGGSSLCFLRSQRRNAFYRIDSDCQVEELSFLEAAPIFKRHRNDDPINQRLPKIHYQQIRHALTYFKQQAQDKIIQEQQLPELTPQQSGAIYYLSAFLKSESTAADQTQRIGQAIEAVKLGRYQHLPRAIVKLQQSQKRTPTVFAKQLEALLHIIDSYVVDDYAVSDNDPVPTQSAVIEPPEIVISQFWVPRKTSSAGFSRYPTGRCLLGEGL